MRLTAHDVAVLEPEQDAGLSRWLESCESVSSYDWRIGELITPLLPIGGRVLDGGAFLGSHTVAYAQAVGPTGWVLAVEPTPAHAQCLRYNSRRYDQVRVLEAALYSHGCHLWLTPNRQNAGATVVGSSDEAEAFEVEAVPIDALNILRLDFLKLDVEGLVLRALEGATQTLKSCRPIVLAEVGDNLKLFGDFTDDVYDFMARFGYGAHVVPPMVGETNTPDQWDVLFWPKERGRCPLS